MGLPFLDLLGEDLTDPEDTSIGCEYFEDRGRRYSRLAAVFTLVSFDFMPDV